MSVTKKKCICVCIFVGKKIVGGGEGNIKKRIGNKVYPKSNHSKKEAQS
jgi:hypothetical protein